LHRDDEGILQIAKTVWKGDSIIITFTIGRTTTENPETAFMVEIGQALYRKLPIQYPKANRQRVRNKSIPLVEVSRPAPKASTGRTMSSGPVSTLCFDKFCIHTGNVEMTQVRK
jgi:hypothetical protein